jgi:hypothetical protein
MAAHLKLLLDKGADINALQAAFGGGGTTYASQVKCKVFGRYGELPAEVSGIPGKATPLNLAWNKYTLRSRDASKIRRESQPSSISNNQIASFAYHSSIQSFAKPPSSCLEFFGFVSDRGFRRTTQMRLSVK